MRGYSLTLVLAFLAASQSAGVAVASETESAHVRMMALNVYVVAGVKQFTYEHGRFPQNLGELREAGLLLQRPYNYIAGRDIPLDGSLREDGDLWLESLGETGLEVTLRTPDKPIRTSFAALPKPRLVSPHSDFLSNPLAANVRAYYDEPVHRMLFYMASAVEEAYQSSGAGTLDEFRASAFFPGLDYAVNPFTGKPLKIEASPGNFTMREKEGKVYLEWYDQEGLVIPDPHVLLGSLPDYDAGKPGRLARMPFLLCRGR